MAQTLRINITADGTTAIDQLNRLSDASIISEKTISQLDKALINLSVSNKKGASNVHEVATAWDDLRVKLEKQRETYVLMDGQLKGLENHAKQVGRVIKNQLTYGFDESTQKYLLSYYSTLQEGIGLYKKEENAIKRAKEEQKELLDEWIKAKQAREEEIAHNAKISMQNQELARKRREQTEAMREEAEIARLTAEAIAEEAKQKEILAAREKALSSFQRTVSDAKQYQEEHDVMVALGNQAGLLQERYKVLDLQLRESIKTTGLSSEKTRKLASEMNNLSEQIKKANYTPFNVRIKNLLSSFVSAQAILWGVRSAFRLVTNTVTESMAAASAAEETWNLFITTFEDVESSALSVASAISSSMGLATSTTQKALGTFGDLALGYGQTDKAALEFAETLTKATLDLISFKNISGSYDEIFSAIASGVAGNVENFRKYGVVITQAEVKTRLQQKGLDKLTGSSLQFAQMQERMEIFIEKTANAQGDMVKTMESTENTTRRLTEATKQWKENFGEDWNKIFTPIKSALADYIEHLNLAREAEEQWAKGETNISVYSNLDPETRREKLLGAIINGVDPNDNNTLVALKKVMVLFQSSADEIISLYDKGGFGTTIAHLREELKAYEEEYKSLNANAKAAEEYKAQIKKLANSYSNLANTLNQINGITFENPFQEFVLVQGDIESQARLNEKLLFGNYGAISKTIEDFKKLENKEFGSAFENALGILSVDEGYKAKLNSIKTFWEEIYNFAVLSDGISANEQKMLDEIALAYNEVNAEYDAHNAKIEAEKERLDAVKTAIQSITSVAENYQNKIAEAGLSSLISSQYAGKSSDFINNEIARASAIASNLALFDEQSKNATDEELIELVSNLSKANSAINDYYDILKKNIELEESQTRSSAYRSALNSARQWNEIPFVPSFSSNAVAQETGAELYSKLYESINEMVASMQEAGVDQRAINDSVRTIREQGLADIRKIVEQTEKDQEKAKIENAKNSLNDSLGEFNDLINLIQGGFAFGDIVTILADLIAKTEVVTRLASILTDNVLPVLNAFLEPLLPVIEMFGKQLQMIAETVLAPLFPIMKAIAKVATIAYGLTNIVVGFVRDAVKIIVGTVITGVTELINGVINLINKIPFVNVGKIDNQWAKDWASTDIFGNVTDTWNEMNEHLAAIDKMSMEIADNTTPSNNEALKIYQDLYNAGTLNATQLAGYLTSLSGKNYDSVGVLSNGLSYQKRSSGAYIAKQSVTIQINGTNLSQEELSNAIKNALESNTYATGVA